jgi:hypothetical protein
MTQLQSRRHALCYGNPAIFLAVIGVSLIITLIFSSNLHQRVIQRLNSEQLPSVTTQEYAHSPPHLESYFPSPDPDRQDYHEWNMRTMRDLHACIVQDNCGPNQRKVALLAAHWFQEAVVGTFRGGEGIWWVQ